MMIFRYMWHLVTMQKELYSEFKMRHDMYAAVKGYRKTLQNMPEYKKGEYGVTKIGDLLIDEDGNLEFVKKVENDTETRDMGSETLEDETTGPVPVE